MCRQQKLEQPCRLTTTVPVAFQSKPHDKRLVCMAKTLSNACTQLAVSCQLCTMCRKTHRGCQQQQWPLHQMKTTNCDALLGVDQCRHVQTECRRQKPQEPYRLTAAGPAPLAIQSKQHGKQAGAFIPGFVRGADNLPATSFPPPQVPASYQPMHKFDQPLQTGVQCSKWKPAKCVPCTCCRQCQLC